MRIYRKLLTWLRLSTKTNSEDYYTELFDFPLYNWIKCHEGSIEYVRRKKVQEIEANADDLEAWEKIYDQYLKKFGLTKLYKKLLNLMKEKAILECTFVITRERFKLTEIEIKEEELKRALSNNNTGLSIEQSLIYLGKWLGYRLNPKEISVIEYFNILNEYGKANKQD